METRLGDAAFSPIQASGVPGGIFGKGPHAMIMYFKAPEKIEEAMRAGWFPSGDIGLTATTYEDDSTIEVHFTNLVVSEPMR